MPATLKRQFCIKARASDRSKWSRGSHANSLSSKFLVCKMGWLISSLGQAGDPEVASSLKPLWVVRGHSFYISIKYVLFLVALPFKTLLRQKSDQIYSDLWPPVDSSKSPFQLQVKCLAQHLAHCELSMKWLLLLLSIILFHDFIQDVKSKCTWRATTLKHHQLLILQSI